jgi:uncharacterized repeat protein (TIGR03803 family)
MSTMRVHRLAISIIAAASLAACGGSQPSIGVPGSVMQTSGSASSRTGLHRATTSPYEVVFRFYRTLDGGRPEGSLLAVNGMLYGTTRYGGGGACNISVSTTGTGCGTVYRLDPKSGTKKRLYSFGGGSADGAFPNGSLIDVNGTLYGTTEYGGGGCGNYGCGTVYSITTAGTERMLHTFAHAYDGFNPLAGLANVNGTLYGTTSVNRTSGCLCGTVYSITKSGSEKVLYTFRGGSDGEYPDAGLIDVDGTLYGTTEYGGSSDDGTVYSITTTGTEKVLHSFGGSPDGALPSSGLLAVSDTLYGTTTSGGNELCYEVSFTCGVVYSITTTGKENVLYTFAPTSDDAGGAHPSAGLANVNGVLYGTTPIGGADNGCEGHGCGVVYSLTTAGQETVLHVFKGGSDGASPDSAMINVNGTLYGTTPDGGASNCPKSKVLHFGCGIVFALTP